ncbi:uncharacterized protein LOC115069011 [Nannospalax galili]|uniref:uncharacterized protein LOC115069011 n=1 Tax=Nannospalax galili TaxID=1026970 RepID=UPI00111C8BC5|nr:uncharacterized protein LOC115069011 [Nannospalax galili]
MELWKWNAVFCHSMHEEGTGEGTLGLQKSNRKMTENLLVPENGEGPTSRPGCPGLCESRPQLAIKEDGKFTLQNQSSQDWNLQITETSTVPRMRPTLSKVIALHNMGLEDREGIVGSAVTQRRLKLLPNTGKSSIFQSTPPSASCQRNVELSFSVGNHNSRLMGEDHSFSSQEATTILAQRREPQLQVHRTKPQLQLTGGD